MLRHTTFAIVSLFACGVASAQQPLSPYWNYGGQSGNPALNGANGYYGTQPGTCVGGNCATGNCATGNFGNGRTICGPNGCYAPGTAPGSVNPYLPRLPVQNGYPQQSGYPLPNGSWPYGTQMNPNYRTLPAYSVPSSSYPGFPNIPSARRERRMPTAGGYPLFGSPAPVTGNWNYYSPVTGAADQYDAYSGPGVLY